MLGRLVLALLLMFALVGSRPFAPPGGDMASLAAAGTQTDTPLNQFVLLLAAGMAMPLLLSRWSLALTLFLRSWPLLLALAWLTATALWSPVPELTIRRAIVLWLMYFGALGVAVCDIPLSEFHRFAAVAIGTVLFIDVLGAIGMPGRSIDAEGRFVGMHGHKNSTGQVAVMGALCWYFFAGRYPWNSFKVWLLAGTVIFYLLILASGSKTGSALAFVAMAWTSFTAVLLQEKATTRWLGWVAVAFGALGAATIVMLAGISATQVGLFLFGDLTFTGRLPLWEAVWRQILQHYWFGYGFGAFWDVNGADNSLGFAKSVGWLGSVGQAHNGYLDLFLQTGLIGLGLALLALGWMAFVTYRLLCLAPAHPFDRPARRFAYAMVLSIALYNLLESSFLRPHHFHMYWLFLVIPLVLRELLAQETRQAAHGRLAYPAMRRSRAVLPINERIEPRIVGTSSPE
ncbi:MAG: O-antigen ligase family protein [Pseudomonadota bacterium]